MRSLQNWCAMTGSNESREPSLNGIVLDLSPEPHNLHCDEILQPEEEEQVQQLSFERYEVGSSCGECGNRVKFTVSAVPDAILLLQDLLVEDSLRFICCSCVRRTKKNGR